ncbi:MAG: hypothetical protein ABS91_03130 [Thiobacillus sp. SCN 64-35]|nr:MAG: hypothetical protein ABS91_03130 [Thiobacillus sp. SCN 64-35]
MARSMTVSSPFSTGRLGELEGTVSGVIDFQQAAHDELAQHGAPHLVGLARADAEHAELLVAETLDLFGGLAEQHVKHAQMGSDTITTATQTG